MKYFWTIVFLSISSFSHSQIQRVPFHEILSSSTCGPCLPANTNLASIFDPNPHKQVYINYQMYFPAIGDPYYTAEGGARRNYYNTLGIPLMFVDGVPQGSPILYTVSQRDNNYQIPSYIKLDVTYQVQCKQVDINARVIVINSFPNDHHLRLAIFEKQTVNNATSNLETDFFHVLKKFAPNETGFNMGSLTAGDTLNFTTSYTFQGDYRLPTWAGNPINHAIEHSVEEFFDLGVAAFVQNQLSRGVLQAAYAEDLIQNDGAMTNLLSPKDEFINGAPFTISTRFQNRQEQIINSADFYYSIDGGPAQSMTAGGLNLAFGENHTVNHSVPWTPTSPGTYTIKSWAGNLNIGQDEVPCNDTLTDIIIIKPSVVAAIADFTWVGSGSLAWFTNASTEDPFFSNSYYWDFDDNGASSTQTDPLWAFTSTGIYNVCLTATNVLGSDTICKSIAVPITGISDAIVKKIHISPNPASGELHLINDLPMRIEGEIISVYGRKISEFNSDPGNSTIDISALRPGLYLIRFKTSQGESIKKVLVE